VNFQLRYVIGEKVRFVVLKDLRTIHEKVVIITTLNIDWYRYTDERSYYI